eukprot:gene6640-3297_t
MPHEGIEANEKIRLVSGLEAVGGGRGVFAVVDIPAGSLVLTERALVEPPSDKGDQVTATAPPEHSSGQGAQEELHIGLARALVGSPQRLDLMAAVAHLHPVQLDHLPADAIAAAQVHYAAAIQALLKMSSDFDESALLRLLLAIQCNAFYSGFYVQCAMLNHACNPSCIKLAMKGGASESHARRVSLIQEQHYFDLGPSPYTPEVESFRGGGEAGADQGSGQGVNEAELAQQLIGLEDKIDQFDARQDSSGVSAGLNQEERAKVLETLQKIVHDMREVLPQFEALLHPRHISLARAHGSLIRACRLTLLHSELMDMKESVERTLDTHQGIGFMLSNAPKQLFSAIPQWSSFPKASSAEHKMKKRAAQIRALYEA